MEITVEKFINKATYDKMGQKIWGVNEKGEFQMIADVRGWGAIQNLFIDKKGKVDIDAAGKFQDELGEWLSDAINKKLNK